MKIAIVHNGDTPVRHPFDDVAVAHSYQMVRQLRVEGHDVTLIASGNSDPSLPIKAFMQTAEAFKSMPAGEKSALYKDAFKALAADDYDAIHINDPSSEILQAALSTDRKYTLTLRKAPDKEIQKILSGNNVLRPIAVSHSLRKQWGLSQKRCAVILNGIDMQFWNPPEDADDRAGLIWNGSIEPDGGLHYAIDVAEHFQATLDICGSIKNGAYFQTEIKPRLTERVRYRLIEDPKALRKAYSSASCLLRTPLESAPFDYIAAEAMACGTPVAAFSTGALPELVPDKSCLAKTENLKALCASTRSAIRKITPSLWRENALASFSLQKMTGDYLQAFRD